MDKNFVWTADLTKRLFQLRFQNEWLFKKKKQPWTEFRNILLQNGFPKEMTLNHVRKKWSYTYDSYKIAKKTKNKNWRYYKMFDKHFGKTKILDKYESWTDEWRLKIITCISEAKEQKVDFHNTWRIVEKAMRSQNLPNDCCVLDMKGLWQHIKMTFNRKHRLKIKKGAELSEWPLYDTMVSYYQKHEPEYLIKLESESACTFFSSQRKTGRYYRFNKDGYKKENENEFHWSKHITETFIQIRLQHDWLFRERKWAWNELLGIMVEEYGFPRTVNSREICRKWASTYAEYQKAKATNNKTWVYYNLFELYLGEGRLSLNPIVDWQPEWVSKFITARTDLEHMFLSCTVKEESLGWREVEKKLRSEGLPLDHSLLDLPEIWTHLLKTFRWKQKFANKGILNEQWPYYEQMAQYIEMHEQKKSKVQKQDPDMRYDDDANDEFEDDMKLFDLKQRLQTKPKCEVIDMGQCRACCSGEGCVNIFDDLSDGGCGLADKLRIIGGIEVEKSDNFPSQICFSCLQELENAYKFRRKCQEIDKQFRNTAQQNIKIEVQIEENYDKNEPPETEHDKPESDDVNANFEPDFSDCEIKEMKHKVKDEKKKIVVRKKIKVRKYKKYDYWKICEICGKPTRNLASHIDMHSIGKAYTCDVCDKKFKFKSGLMIHKAVHDPTPKKTCEVCGKTFHILAQYRRHFVYHANERKHECDTCGKRFNTLDILRVHKRTHTDERPFSCQECGKTFRTAGCVSRHKRIVHKTVKCE